MVKYFSKKMKDYLTPREFDENGRGFRDYSPGEILEYIERSGKEFLINLTPEETEEFIDLQKEKAFGKYGQVPLDLEKNIRDEIAKLKNEKSKSQ